MPGNALCFGIPARGCGGGEKGSNAEPPSHFAVRGLPVFKGVPSVDHSTRAEPGDRVVCRPNAREDYHFAVILERSSLTPGRSISLVRLLWSIEGNGRAGLSPLSAPPPTIYRRGSFALRGSPEPPAATAVDAQLPFELDELATNATRALFVSAPWSALPMDSPSPRLLSGRAHGPPIPTCRRVLPLSSLHRGATTRLSW